MKKSAVYKYKFSFVMPVFNVENYLAETIESILAQTLHFEDNVELILVNDGSSDQSEEVCLRYQQQFPDNIRYLKQRNLGVSAARNKGVEAVQGKYISFLDSDDTLSPDTLEKVYTFFEHNYDEIDFVSIKLEFFEAMEGPHPLNYKYDSSRVVDIAKEPESIQLSGGSVFVKSEAFKNGKYRFDSNIQISEDAKLLTEMVLEKNAYGVVAEPTYFYRKRSQGKSAIGGSSMNKTWYFETPRLVYKHLFDYAEKKFGHLPKYVQYLVMYDLQWRLKQRDQQALNGKELAEYKDLIFGLLRRIDDDVIMAQRFMQLEHKFFALDKKYDFSILKQADQDGLRFSYKGLPLYDYGETKPVVHIELFEISDDTMVIEGFFNGFLFKGTKLRFKAGNEWFDAKLVDRPLRQVRFLGSELVYTRNCFRVSLPLKVGKNISAYVANNDDRMLLRLYSHQNARFSRVSNKSYRVAGRHILLMRANKVVVQNYSLYRHVVRETKRNYELLRKGAHYGWFVRSLHFVNSLVKKDRKVWLVSDRINAAGDNGEAFFRYVTKHHKDADIYFVISHDSQDYQRMKRYGRVIDRNSLRYRLLFLQADKVISSHADDFVINAFEKRVDEFVDLYKFDFVFLQHGIIHNDLSRWLNRLNKNIKLFVTSTQREHDAIASKAYGYGPDVVKLVGLSRYDRLSNRPKRKLVLTPTWRKELVEEADQLTGVRTYGEDFKQSEYCQFYRNFMASEALREALKKHNMVGELYLHPSLGAQIKDFESNPYFKVKRIPYDYKTAFTEGSIMVTDYSSVAFDFAYLKKPIVYTQFDKERFYQNHLWNPGYFSYERDGFGPVVYDLEAAIGKTIELIENGSRMPETYMQRVEKFFFAFDKDNAKRTYEAIIAMNSHAKEEPWEKQ